MGYEHLDSGDYFKGRDGLESDWEKWPYIKYVHYAWEYTSTGNFQVSANLKSLKKLSSDYLGIKKISNIITTCSQIKF